MENDLINSEKVNEEAAAIANLSEAQGQSDASFTETPAALETHVEQMGDNAGDSGDDEAEDDDNEAEADSSKVAGLETLAPGGVKVEGETATPPATRAGCTPSPTGQLPHGVARPGVCHAANGLRSGPANGAARATVLSCEYVCMHCKSTGAVHWMRHLQHGVSRLTTPSVVVCPQPQAAVMGVEVDRGGEELRGKETDDEEPRPDWWNVWTLRAHV